MMTLIKGVGQPYKDFTNDDIIYKLDVSLDEAVDRILRVNYDEWEDSDGERVIGGIKNEWVIFNLKNGVKCFSSESYEEDGVCYLYAESETEYFSIIVDETELENFVQFCVKEEIANEY